MQAQERTPTTSETLLGEMAERPDSPRAEEFARIYEPVLRRHVARVQRSLGAIQPADRDDIVQDAFLAVRSALPGFRYDPARGRFRAYLRSVVRNLVLRRRESAARASRDAALFADLAGAGGSGAAGGELALQIWSLALARVLRSGRFSPNTVAAFRRVALEETPVAAVAEEFKLKPNAVYQLKNRVLRAVAAELRRFGGRGRSLEELADALVAAEREGR